MESRKELIDIVNREVINLTNCDQEPIHIPGSIQPHGALVATDPETGIIRFCSSNTQAFTGHSYSSLLGNTFASVFGEVTPTQLKAEDSGKVEVVSLTLNGNAAQAFRHLHEGYLIYEIESAAAEQESPDLYELSREFVEYIENTSTLVELCDKVASGIRKITGYDRVMVYRFDEMYNGEVIAENKLDDLESFLGLHYPHTDIPVQARELYIKNQLRMIVDINYTADPIYTINDGSGQQLDLSFSMLRSVSPIHCQYLRNMGVGATLTISLLHKSKLWGLIACHHYGTRFLNYHTRIAAKLAGHLITSQIETRRINEQNNIFMAGSQVTEKIFRQNDQSFGSLEKIFSNTAILQVCNTAGVALLFNDRLYTCGHTPSDENIRHIAAYLDRFTNHTQWHSNALPKELPELAAACQDFPGLIYFPIDHAGGNTVLWFRRETVTEVGWAGDPAKAIEKDKNGLSPRKSFELWKEKVVNQSKPWLDSEIASAGHFVNTLQKYLTTILIAEEEEKQRTLAIALKQTNDELENINWISTHDLQEPLRKIQMLASIMLHDPGQSVPEAFMQKVEKMSRFAGRMQMLLKDLLQYNNLKQYNGPFETIDLHTLLEDVKTDTKELSKEAVFNIAPNLPTVNGITFLLRQMFLNLIYNSIKFSHSERTAEISIREINPQDAPEIPNIKNYIVLKYSDNGTGFEPAYNENVFKIFTRLEGRTESSGSGIGLALCRNIMNTHKGYIKAEGKPEKGVDFYMYFPKIRQEN